MKNLPAFPLNTPKWHESVSDAGFQDIDFTMGMTLRDYFAARAIQGLFSSGHFKGTVFSENTAEVARVAYIMADAMLKAREA